MWDVVLNSSVQPGTMVPERGSWQRVSRWTLAPLGLTALGNGSELWGTVIWALYLDPGVGSELAKSRELR